MSREFWVNIKVPELQGALKNINKYDETTQEKLRSAVRSSTQNVMAGTIRRAPIRTSELVKSIGMSYNAETNVGVVRAKSPHAHLVEYGHAGRTPQSKRTPEHPFMRHAFEAEKSNLIKAVEEAVKP